MCNEYTLSMRTFRSQTDEKLAFEVPRKNSDNRFNVRSYFFGLSFKALPLDMTLAGLVGSVSLVSTTGSAVL